ncbi:MAG: metal ABC transporter solute-binding protein, Zn/Mn family, partial [Chloroflexota bacterium]
PHVHVYTILNDPRADPHEYEPSATDAKAIAGADIVIENGLGYDAFIDKLLGASPRSGRVVLNAGKLTGHHDGDNPHLWYQTATMPRLADALAASLSRLDRGNRAAFQRRVAAFHTSLTAVTERIDQTKRQYAGTAVLATEPVFDYMAEEMMLKVVDGQGAFQRAVANGNDPPAQAVAAFRQQLASGAIKVLIYNLQTTTPITEQMRAVASQHHVPVVGVTEMEPAATTYQQWMIGELDRLRSALAQAAS